MWVLYLICTIAFLVVYAWKETFRHIINQIIVAILKVAGWMVKIEGWIISGLLWAFQKLEGVGEKQYEKPAEKEREEDPSDIIGDRDTISAEELKQMMEDDPKMKDRIFTKK